MNAQNFKEVKSRRSRKRKVQEMEVDVKQTINSDISDNNTNKTVLPDFEPIKKEKLSVFILNFVRNY